MTVLTFSMNFLPPVALTMLPAKRSLKIRTKVCRRKNLHFKQTEMLKLAYYDVGLSIFLRELLMKKSRSPVPVAFYKVILDVTPPMKMIGFIVPNESSKRRLASFSVSVDEVERLTGYDFFSDLDDDIENRLEQTCNWQSWMK